MGCCKSFSYNPPIDHTQFCDKPFQRQSQKSGFVKTWRKLPDKNYQICEKIGEGGFSEVYRGIDLRTMIPRAIKILRINPQVIGQRQPMLQEFNILKHLDHPNIVNVIELYIKDNNLFLVEEFYTGGSLQDKLDQQGVLSEQQASKYIFQLLQALVYCHGQGVIHHDIKPENLIFENDDNLRLVDFGVSVLKNNNLVQNNFSTTLNFMPPEFLQCNYDQRCDVWSAGVLLFYVISGMFPFNGKSDDCLVSDITTRKQIFTHKAWSKVSPACKDLISRMLDKNYQTRLQAYQCIQHPWILTHNSQDINQVPYARDILKKLSTFPQKSKLEWKILSFLLPYLPKSSSHERKNKVFKQLDINGDGRISTQELVDGLKKVGLNHDDYMIQKIMNSCDTDQNGFIDFTEFRTAVKTWQLGDENLARSVFKIYDMDNTGYICMQNLAEFLGWIDEEEYLNIAKQYLNGKDELDFDCFYMLIKRISNDENEDSY